MRFLQHWVILRIDRTDSSYCFVFSRQILGGWCVGMQRLWGRAIFVCGGVCVVHEL